MRDAGEHAGAVQLNLRELVGHAVEADIDFPHFARGHVFFQPVAYVVAAAHAGGGHGQVFERAVDQARQQGGAHKGGGAQAHDPQQPGAAAQHGAHARAVHEQPVGVALDGKADPQARLVIDAAGHEGAGAKARHEFLADALLQGAVVKEGEAVIRLVRSDAHFFLLGQRFDERDAGDGVRVDERGAREIDQRGDLPRALDGARFVLQRAKKLIPRQGAAQQHQRQQKEGAPEKAQARAGAPALAARRAFLGRRSGRRQPFQRHAHGIEQFGAVRHVRVWERKAYKNGPPCFLGRPEQTKRAVSANQLAPSGTKT